MIVFKTKLKIEYAYRKYGDNEVFRTMMENILIDTYKKMKEKHKYLDKDNFIKMVSKLAFTKKVKKMLEEDAKEALKAIEIQENLYKYKNTILEYLARLN